MIKELKPLDFESTNIFKCFFTTITLLILQTVLVAGLVAFFKNSFIIYIIVDIIFITLLYFINKKYIDKCIKDFKKDIKKNGKNILLVTSILLLIEFIINFIIMKLTGTKITSNELLLNEANNKNLILLFIYVIITCPIYETMIMLLPYNNFKNRKTVFIFVSIVFALIHLTSASTLIDLLYLIPYLLMSFAFNYGYYKSNNILMSIIAHSINDLIVFVLLLVL